MPDPLVIGAEAADDGLRGRYRYRAAEAGEHARRAESAAAYVRAYMAHGDQLSALEAEAAMFGRPTLPGSAGYLRHRRVGARLWAALGRAAHTRPRGGRAGPRGPRP